MKRLLVTGPIGRTEEYAAAARGVGWEVDIRELIEVRDCELPHDVLGRPADVICITSKHALPALAAARSAPIAVVGDETASLVMEMGKRVMVGPAPSAMDLEHEIARRFPAGSRVLWPRGPLSDELARSLRTRGYRVEDPVVYETVFLSIELPEADAVFLASPSAVDAFVQNGGRVRSGVAIGTKTAKAMEDQKGSFVSVVKLPHPSAEQLAACLEKLNEA